MVLGGAVLAASLSSVFIRRRRRRASHGRPDARIEEAWQAWLALDRLDEVERRRRAGLLEHMNEAVRESVHRNLLDFEAGLRREAGPLLAVRRELMDSVDRRVLNLEILDLPPEVRLKLRSQSQEVLQSDDEARTYLAANEVRMAVLREYGGRRFGDRADGDWFDVYQKASRLKQRGARGFIRRTLSGTQSDTDDARYQSITRVDQEIRTRLLQVPAGTRFRGFGAGQTAEE
jgi:hypothetical protein